MGCPAIGNPERSPKDPGLSRLEHGGLSEARGPAAGDGSPYSVWFRGLDRAGEWKAKSRVEKLGIVTAGGVGLAGPREPGWHSS